MLHIFTFLTDPKRIEYLKETAQMNDTQIHYLVNSSWNGYVDKITGMRKAIDPIPDEDIICFIDAYDVLINQPGTVLLDKFKEEKKDLIFGAEMNCYPSNYHPYFTNLYNDLKTMNQTKFVSKHLYLNSGGYIGYKHAIHSCLYWKTEPEIHRICSVGGDQSYFIEYYLANALTKNIGLDHEGKMFLNMHLISWNDIEFSHGHVKNKVLMQIPCMIHFNGGTWQTSKEETKTNNIMPVFVEKMKQSKLLEDDNSSLNLNEYQQIITSTCVPRSQI